METWQDIDEAFRNLMLLEKHEAESPLYVDYKIAEMEAINNVRQTAIRNGQFQPAYIFHQGMRLGMYKLMQHLVTKGVLNSDDVYEIQTSVVYDQDLSNNYSPAGVAQ
jgi:hypothetical protein